MMLLLTKPFCIFMVTTMFLWVILSLRDNTLEQKLKMVHQPLTLTLKCVTEDSFMLQKV